ncbi:hypothetical protein HK100_005869, partial [Physocladia obscura]
MSELFVIEHKWQQNGIPNLYHQDFPALDATTNIQTLLRDRNFRELEGELKQEQDGAVEAGLEQDGKTTLRNITPQVNVGMKGLNDGLAIRSVDIALVEHGLPFLRATTADYFGTPLPLSFNWQHVAQRLPAGVSGEWYVVAFRSVRTATADAQQLYAADAAAHEEALGSGGLLKYWYAELNTRRECLAMCVWASRAFAARASRMPNHRVAVALAARMYESYTLERWRLEKRPD